MYFVTNAHKKAHFASHYHKTAHRQIRTVWHTRNTSCTFCVVILISRHSRTSSAVQVMTCSAAHRVSSENRPVLGRYRLYVHLSSSLCWRIQPLRSLCPRSIRAVAVVFGHDDPGRHRQECRQPHGATETGIKTGRFKVEFRKPTSALCWQVSLANSS